MSGEVTVLTHSWGRLRFRSVRRLTKKQDDPTSPNTVEEYAQDALGRMTLAKLSRGGAEHAEDRYYYDGLSRLTREGQSIKGGTACCPEIDSIRLATRGPSSGEG